MNRIQRGGGGGGRAYIQGTYNRMYVLQVDLRVVWASYPIGRRPPERTHKEWIDPNKHFLVDEWQLSA